jgi:two-component system chemotaxis response regulator CheB
MPGAVAGAGLADDVLPLDGLADRVIGAVRRSHAA